MAAGGAIIGVTVGTVVATGYLAAKHRKAAARAEFSKLDQAGLVSECALEDN